MNRSESSVARMSARSASGIRRAEERWVVDDSLDAAAHGCSGEERRCRYAVARLTANGGAGALHWDRRVALSDELGKSSSLASSILGSAIPRISCAFTWRSIRALEMRSSFSSFAMRFSCCSICLSLASLLGFGPGRLACSPARPHCSSCSRQSLICELYNPSRRSNAPT